MNRRRLVLPQLLTLLPVLMLLPAAPAMAQVLNPIPPAVKAGNDRDQIAAAVQKELPQRIAQLQKDDPRVQATARDTIIGDVSGAPRPSATYLDVYAEQLNQQLQGVMKSPDLRVRLNAAIAAARVAEQAQNARLRDVALLALGDETEAVVLWGLRIAEHVLPTLLQVQNPQNQKVLQTIGEVVQKYPTGLMTQYAYRALMLDILGTRRVPAAAMPRVIPVIVPEMQKILEWRISLYRNSTPSDPALEARNPVLFLTERSVWAAQKRDQQERTLQLLHDLMWAAAQRAAHNQQANLQPEDREALANVVQRAASSIQVAGNAMNAPAIANAVQPAMNINPRTITGIELLATVEPVLAQLRGIQQMTWLKNPPAIEAQAVIIEDPTEPEPAPEGETEPPVDDADGTGVPPVAPTPAAGQTPPAAPGAGEAPAPGAGQAPTPGQATPTPPAR